MKKILVCALAFILSACSVHHHNDSNKAHPARDLDREHQSKTVVIVKIKPSKKKNCWRHTNHWHCRR